LSETEISQLVENTRQHGGFVSDKRMPDGSLLPYELNINYLDALSHRAFGEPDESAVNKMLTAHAILLSLQGVPGIYFHSLFGSRGDRIGAEACGIKRRINREKLDQARLETELARSGSLRARVFAGMRNLLRIRQGQSAFHPQAQQRILALDPRLFTVCRIPPDPKDRMICLHNVSPETVPMPNLANEIPGVPGWQDLLTGQRYGWQGGGTSPVELTRYQTIWLRAR
jgi:sucrose phosphorylase